MSNSKFFPIQSGDNTSQEILKSLKRQEKQNKVRTFFSIITCLAVTLGMGTLAYIGILVIEPVTLIVEKVPSLVVQAEEISSKLNSSLKMLNELDIQGSLDSLDALSDEATKTLQLTTDSLVDTLDGIKKIDFVALNDSIVSLARVTSVLNSIFGK